MPLKCRLTIGEDDKFCYVYFTTIKNKGFILTVGIMYVVHMDFPVAQTVKNLPATEETQVRSLGQEESLEKGMAAHSSILV